MDIIKELGSSRKYTLHSHTQFCDGHAPMEDFVFAAVRDGFTHYGFSPHSPIPIESPCNMSMESVPVYLDEFRRLQNAYGDRIRLYASMEIDYLNPDWGPANDYFQSLPLDYRIGSVHFIPDLHGRYVDVDGSAERFALNMAQAFDDDIEYVITTFYTQSVDMVRAGGFDIIGHFDKIGQNASAYCPGIEDSGLYRRLVDNLIDEIIARKPVVEINTKAKVPHGRIFPSERYIPALIDAGVPLVVNSDAHWPDLIDASRDYAFSLIDRSSFADD